jgi:hypothetical protein
MDGFIWHDIRGSMQMFALLRQLPGTANPIHASLVRRTDEYSQSGQEMTNCMRNATDKRHFPDSWTIK